jgi:hypothetical protein
MKLHAHALKNRNPPLTLCKSHFDTTERKRRRELETRKKTKLDESEITARYLYLKEAPSPKPQIKGMQYSLDTVNCNSS